MKSTNIYCPNCFAGQLQPKNHNYAMLADQELMIIPHRNTLVCPLCHYREFGHDVNKWAKGLPDGLTQPNNKSLFFGDESGEH